MAEFLSLAALVTITAVIVLPVVGLVRRAALKCGYLDRPNHRSSHNQPTPTGGGVAVIVGWVAIVIILWSFGGISRNDIVAIVPPTLLLAVTGYLDDRFDLSARLRLLTHFGAVSWYVFSIDNAAPAGLLGFDELPWLASFILIVSLVWLINLFNFMDGIDGIAGSEAVFVLVAICLLSGFSAASSAAVMAATLAGACIGFLYWNWPPAKIFLGDVGSGPLGFLIGAIGLSYVASTGASVAILVILLGVFVVDASVTLFRRVGSRQSWYRAHRTHAYQRLAVRWSSHQRVTLFMLLINLLWLLPMAAMASREAAFSGAILIVALVPLIIAAIVAGAGLPGVTLDETQRSK